MPGGNGKRDLIYATSANSDHAPFIPVFSDVLIDGLPQEDGAYLIFLHGAKELFAVRYTLSDGRRIWAAGRGRFIEEEKICLYWRVKT